jgi:iron complex outermembrane recepter protein
VIKFRRSLIVLLVVASIAAGFTLRARGAEAPPGTENADSSDADTLPSVIVTAEKRTENLQDVPVSIAVLSRDTLEKEHLESPADLAGLIPNLQMQNTVGDEIPIFSLRGVSMSDFSLNQPSPVATYYDEVYKGNFALFGVGMFDLERIEVLRGPQGTLYGKNTTGGAINLVAIKPGFDTEGYLSAGYGNYNRRELSGAFQTGLSDTLAARIAFTYARQDGWFENLYPDHPNLNATNDYGIRGQLLFKPISSLQFLLRLSMSNESVPNYGVYAQPYPNLGCIGGGVYTSYHDLNPIENPYVDDCRTGLGPRQLEAQYTPDRENRTYSAALTTTWQLADRLTLTAISSWDKASLLIPEDSDGTYLGVINEPYADHLHQIAQDVRLTSSFSGPFNFIAGAYYNLEDVFNSTTFSFYNLLNVPNAAGVYSGAGSVQSCENGIPLGFLDCDISNAFYQRKQSTAFYSDMTWVTSAHVTLHGGLRYTYDTGRQSDFTSNITSTEGVFIQNLIPGTPPYTGFNPGCSGSDGTGECRFSKGELTGKAGFDYKIDADNLLYASVSRGYRASAFNAQAFFGPGEMSVARPETVDAYELGSKSQLSGRLQLNSALFYYQYQNQQVLSTNPQTAEQTLINLARSRIFGGELDLTARPLSALTFTGGLGLLSTRVEEGAVSGVSVAGTQLANAPKLSASAAAEYMFFANNHCKATVRLDGTYLTKQYFDPLNQLDQPSYGLVNAHLSLRSADDHWGIAVWGRNLFDTFYLTSRINVPGFGFIYNHEGAPTMYGVTIDYRL